jgi:hypothetical protein
MTDYQLGQHEADIKSLKEDVRLLVENQTKVMEFIAKQEGGRKYIWAVFGAIGAIAAFMIQIVSFVADIIKVKF